MHAGLHRKQGCTLVKSMEYRKRSKPQLSLCCHRFIRIDRSLKTSSDLWNTEYLCLANFKWATYYESFIIYKNFLLKTIVEMILVQFDFFGKWPVFLRIVIFCTNNFKVSALQFIEYLPLKCLTLFPYFGSCWGSSLLQLGMQLSALFSTGALKFPETI